MMNRYLIAITVAGVMSFGSAHGAIFTDDFEDLTVGAVFTDGLGPGGNVEGITANQQIASNTGTPFGSSNIYADLNDDDGDYANARSGNYTDVSNAVSTFQFDFHETSAGGGDSLIFGYAMQGQQLNGGGNRVRLNLDDGFITGLSSAASNSYSLDTSYTLYMIFNDTASPVSYDGGTVAAGSADVWLEDFGGGNATFAGSVNVNNSQTASYRVAFRTFNSQEQQVYVDNVSLSTGAAAIPEPTTTALLLGGLGLLTLLRHRR